MGITLVFLVLAVLCFTVSQLHIHKKGRWIDSAGMYSFFGAASYRRKYKSKMIHDSVIGSEPFPVKAPQTWYYKFFKIPYREAFPLSATLLVNFTDLYHLSQMFFKLFLALSFAPLTGWIWAGVIWVLWGISFTIFYRLLSR